MLYGRHKGRRIAVYVPEDLVAANAPQFGQWARLAGALLLQAAAPRYIKTVEAGESAQEQEELSDVGSEGRANQFCRLGIAAAKWWTNPNRNKSKMIVRPSN